MFAEQEGFKGQDLAAYCESVARRARAASRGLATAQGAQKNAWLLAVAGSLVERSEEILTANAEDLARARELGLENASLDRLRLNLDRLHATAEGLREVAALPDPIGQVRESSIRPNGLEWLKV